MKLFKKKPYAERISQLQQEVRKKEEALAKIRKEDRLKKKLAKLKAEERERKYGKLFSVAKKITKTTKKYAKKQSKKTTKRKRKKGKSNYGSNMWNFDLGW